MTALVRSNLVFLTVGRSACQKFHLPRPMQASRSPKPTTPLNPASYTLNTARKSAMQRRTSLACVSHCPALPTASKDASKLHRWMARHTPGNVIMRWFYDQSRLLADNSKGGQKKSVMNDAGPSLKQELQGSKVNYCVQHRCGL